LALATAHTAAVFGPILVKLHSRPFAQSDTQRLCAPSVNNDARPPKLLSGPRLKIKTRHQRFPAWERVSDRLVMKMCRPAKRHRLLAALALPSWAAFFAFGNLIMFPVIVPVLQQPERSAEPSISFRPCLQHR
jgi:hypothetical protein